MNQAEIKERVTKRVREMADALDWLHLNIPQRTQHYDAWTEDAGIGGLLAQVMDPSKVRVYLKDTVMGKDTHPRRPQLAILLVNMGIKCDQITREFVKPQGVLCNGTHLYTMTVAEEWKGALLIFFERGKEIKRLKRNVVYITDHTTGRFVDKIYRDLIDEAARRLGIKWSGSPMDLLITPAKERSAQMAKVREGNKSTEGRVEAALLNVGIEGWEKHRRILNGNPRFLLSKLQTSFIR